MEAAVTKPEAASAGTGTMSESGNQTQEVSAGVFFFLGTFQVFFVHQFSYLLHHYALAPAKHTFMTVHITSLEDAEKNYIIHPQRVIILFFAEDEK